MECIFNLKYINFSDRRNSLLDIRNDIFDMFDTYRNAYQTFFYS